MAFTPISLLLRRRLSSQRPNPYLSILSLSRNIPFSTSQANHTPNPQDPKPSNLSARLSFVFDQIDAIERERSQKDETLQRIRAWRESKNQKKNTNEETLKSESGSTELELADLSQKEVGREGVLLNKEVELVHPWPEWIELMERLFQQNYFDHRRKDEDKMVQDLGFDMSDVVEEGFDFTRDWKTVQTACLNFGRDRFDILRSLSRQDIQVLVGYGCPSTDKKVVFSAKLLRKHVHLDEGDVCSSCSLRSSCERGFLLTNKEDEARTIDIMRVLLTFGFDPVNRSVDNKFLLKQKNVKTVVRKLLHEVVKLSAVPIDPNLPPPVIKKPPPKVKQPPPPPKRRIGRDDIEMKKGDWLCPKCDFMNFAKNTGCLQCDAKRPKRQLLPGEWECPECNFLNYRRNMACFHCEHKRPHDDYMDEQVQERQLRGPRTRLEKVASRPEVSNAWNFDFDDNESDGADVANFEHADSRRMGEEESPLDSRVQGGNFKRSEDDFKPSILERESPVPDINRPGIGFDDFDEEDDVDSYEVDTGNSIRTRPLNDLSEGFSDSEDIENSNNSTSSRHGRETDSSSYKMKPKMRQRKTAFSGFENDEMDFDSDGEPSSIRPKWKSNNSMSSRHGRGTDSSSYNMKPKMRQRKTAFSGSENDEMDFDSDGEPSSIRPKWKSSHVTNSRGRGRNGASRKGLNFVSDAELETDDDLDEDFGSRVSNNRRNNFRNRGSRSDGSDFDSDDTLRPRDRPRGGNSSRGARGGNRRNSFDDDFDRPYRGSREDFDRPFRGSREDFDRPFRGSRDDFDRSSRGFHDRSSFGDDFDRPSRGSRGSNSDRSSRGFRDRRSSFGDDFDRPSRGFRGSRSSFGDDFDRPSRGSRGSNRGSTRGDYGGRRGRNFDGPRRGGGGRGGWSNRSDMDGDFDDSRPQRVRIIER